MNEVITIGVDLAKNVFQVHGVDADGGVLFRRQLRRRQVLAFFKKQPPCLVGMEACATAYYWAREIAALGHEVKLMPPRYVKAYVKRNKNDAADAEAILRGRHAADDALCGGEERRAAERADGASDTGTSGPPAHHAGQRDPGAHGRVRGGGPGRSATGQGAARGDRRPRR